MITIIKVQSSKINYQTLIEIINDSSLGHFFKNKNQVCKVYMIDEEIYNFKYYNFNTIQF